MVRLRTIGEQLGNLEELAAAALDPFSGLYQPGLVERALIER